MRRKSIFSLLLGLMTMAGVAHGRTIYFGGETEVVNLVYGGTALLRFPSEVRTISGAKRFIIKPADPDQPNYALLTVEPRFSAGANEVVFILNDGTTIKAKLVVVSSAIPERTDVIYEFKSKEALLANDGENKAGSGLSEMELMKAMIRGDEVAGYEIKDVSRTVSPGFKGVSTRLIRIYTGNQFNGYIFEITNQTKNKALSVVVQSLSLGDPNLAILSNVDREVIEPEKTGNHKALLRIVAKPTSLYNQLVLPIETVEKR